MGEFLANNLSEVLSFLGGVVGGMIAGSLITLRVKGRNWVTGSGSNVDQSGTTAGGDIVGRDKRTTGGR